MTFGSPPSITQTTEFVVPRSIPMTFDMVWPLAAARADAKNVVVGPGSDDPLVLPGDALVHERGGRRNPGLRGYGAD